MVGQLHPIPLIARVLPTLPLPELALLAWEMHRGVGKAHFEKCSVCQHVEEGASMECGKNGNMMNIKVFICLFIN